MIVTECPRTTEAVARWLAGAGRGAGPARVGLELEVAVLDRGEDGASAVPTPHEGPRGIGALLERACADGGWTPGLEAGRVIAATGPAGDTLTLEPGGQLELSTAPAPHVAGLVAQARERMRWLADLAEGLGLSLVGGGLAPWAQADAPWMPKGRYRVMREHFAALGAPARLAHHMMQRTLSAQVTLDYVDEADAAALLRLGVLAAPVATAAFACSPLEAERRGGDGAAAPRLAPNGLRSLRAEIWRFTDPARAGEPPGVAEARDLGPYVAWALEAPLMFRLRGGEHVPLHGAPLRPALEAGRWEDGTPLDLDDVRTALNAVFPDARLKRGLVELRSVDGPRPGDLGEVPAFWVGLAYDPEARRAALDLLARAGAAARAEARARVPREGLAAPWGAGTVLDVARDLADLAHEGLANRVRAGLEEPAAVELLSPLRARLARGQSPADELLATFAAGGSAAVLSALRWT